MSEVSTTTADASGRLGDKHLAFYLANNLPGFILTKLLVLGIRLLNSRRFVWPVDAGACQEATTELALIIRPSLRSVGLGFPKRSIA